MILMEDLSSEDDAGTVAGKILAAMRIPFTLDDRPLTVTTSIGIAFCRNASMTAQQYLCLSDEALYNAKAAGRDRLSVMPAMSPAA